MSTPFSAGPHALGYYHQLRYALYALLQAKNEDAVVAIEGLDDVTVEEGGRLNLDQLKHHLSAQASLTNSSAELWKPLRVWAETMGTWDPTRTTLHLITTATAPDGSVAALLRARESGGRDVAKAHAELLDVASQSKNITLAPAFAAFTVLAHAEQRRLLDSLVVADEAPTIIDTTKLIESGLALTVRKQHVSAVRERLEGWWFEKAIRHIWGGSVSPITKSSLVDHLFSITDTIGRDVLPLDYEVAEPGENPDPEGDQRQFVQQLRAVSMGASAIRFAILDYYRAFEQRSRWAREHLLVDDELAGYERRLVEAWERYVARWEDERGTSEDEHVQFGRRIYRWVDEGADVKLRPELPATHKYVMRGSFHMLADLLPPKVHWHPGFVEQLEAVLAVAKTPS